MKLILTVGISNSGKTTWAEKYELETEFKVLNLNRDDLRAFMFTESNNIKDYKFSKSKENQVTEEQKQRCILFAQTYPDATVIISDTNLNEKTRNKWKELSEKYSWEYEEIVFDVEVHVAKIRNIKRDYSVSPEVIDIQYKQFRKYCSIEQYHHNPKIDQCAVIFDMDGTLSNMDGIRKPYEWKKCINDKPRWQIIELLKMYYKKYTIIILSGRDGCCYDETVDWLDKHEIPFDFLFLREKGDMRSDPIVKEEMFNKYIKPAINVKFVVDDRQRMVDHWRNMGVECWQVAPGNF